MRKLVTAIILLFVFAITSNAQVVNKDAFGAWGYMDGTAQASNMWDTLDIKGMHIILDSREIRPVSNGSFDWSVIDGAVNTYSSKGILVGIQLQFGQGVPADLLDETKTTVIKTSRGGDNPVMIYPDYFSTKYQTFYWSTLKAYINHVAANPKVYYCHLAEGSTGDNEPYKGKRVDGKPEISREDWQAFRKKEWDSVKIWIAASVNPYLQLLVNAGNDGEDYDVINSVLGVGNWFTKQGTLSHDLIFNAEGSYFARAFIISRGEAQGYVPDYSTHKNKEAFLLFCSALTGQLTMFNLTQKWVKEPSFQLKRLIAFYNKYANIENGERGFILPCDKVDFADTIRFPESTYGKLINGTGATGDSLYKYQKKLLTLAAAGMSKEFDEYKTQTTVAQYISWQRVLNIRNQFPSLGFAKREVDQYGLPMKNNTAGDPANSWEDDFVVCGHRNYGRNIDIIDQYENVQGGARVGVDTSMLGRLCARGYFKLDFNATNSNGLDTVRVTIHYYDQSGGMSEIPFGYQGQCQDFVNLFTIPITNTNQWKSKTFDITNFALKANSWDFALNSADVWIGLIEYEIRKK